MSLERGRSKRHSRLFCSCSYYDPFIRDTARRVNLIAAMAARLDFEAARFMFELRRAIIADTHEPPKRA